MEDRRASRVDGIKYHQTTLLPINLITVADISVVLVHSHSFALSWNCSQACGKPVLLTQ